MNQVTNKTPFGLLTRDEESQLSLKGLENGLYSRFRDAKWQDVIDICFESDSVYRLKIMPDEWYYIETVSLEESLQSAVYKGRVIDICTNIKTLRPAKPSEIPKPEPSLLERIQEKWPDKEVVMLEWDEHCDDVFMLNMKYKDCHWHHITAQSMKGFQGYVYFAHPFTVKPMPSMTDNRGYVQPIAVLFTK